jgi:hypothetical protein
MKKTLILLLCIPLCLSLMYTAIAEQAREYIVGGTVTFGSYEQDNNTDNGKEPVEWLVLEVKGTQALLLSKYCLDARPYNTDFVPITWAECTLRAWLNDTLIDELFSAGEQAMIPAVTVVNTGSPNYGTVGGDDTTDQLFLLSKAEVIAYFPEQADRQAQPTAYAVARGAYINETTGNTWWWLRSPGTRQIDASGVRADGRVSGYGSRDVYRPSGTIRPVCWVNITE